MPPAAAFPPSSAVLLDRMASTSTRKYGNDLTVLMWAAGYSDEAGVKDMVEVMKLLIDRGARHRRSGQSRPDGADDRRRAQPHGAVDLLLARGADKSLKDKQGKTAADLTTLTALREKLAATQ